MFYEAKVNYFFNLGDNFYKEFIEHKKKLLLPITPAVATNNKDTLTIQPLFKILHPFTADNHLQFIHNRRL